MGLMMAAKPKLVALFLILAFVCSLASVVASSNSYLTNTAPL
jgi:hypothetical protein